MKFSKSEIDRDLDLVRSKDGQPTCCTNWTLIQHGHRLFVICPEEKEISVVSQEENAVTSSSSLKTITGDMVTIEQQGIVVSFHVVLVVPMVINQTSLHFSFFPHLIHLCTLDHSSPSPSLPPLCGLNPS